MERKIRSKRQNTKHGQEIKMISWPLTLRHLVFSQIWKHCLPKLELSDAKTRVLPDNIQQEAKQSKARSQCVVWFCSSSKLCTLDCIAFPFAQDASGKWVSNLGWMVCVGKLPTNPVHVVLSCSHPIRSHKTPDHMCAGLQWLQDEASTANSISFATSCIVTCLKSQC